VSDLVVVPARPDATVAGRSTLQPTTDFLVRVFSQRSPAFEREAEAVVTDNATWTATLDLSVAVDDQPIVIEAVLGGDVVATADGVIGPPSASVRFDDQQLAADEREVIVTVARLELGGFVAVTDGRDGPILGVSEYLDAGTRHVEVPIELDAPLENTARLVATARLDVGGDRTFDPAIDRPYPEGTPVTDAAFVDARTPSPPVTDTPERTPSGGGLDVLVSLAAGGLGTLGLRRAAQRLADRIRRHGDSENTPPVAKIVVVPENPRPGRPVLFDGTLSFDPEPDDDIAHYGWSIPDTDRTGPRQVHVFGTAGDHEVDLRVRDEAGATDRASVTVPVETGSSRLELEAVHPVTSGSGSTDLRDEFVRFRNAGDDPLAMGRWSVHEARTESNQLVPGPHAFTFPDRYTLPAGETVSLHTGSESGASDASGPADHRLYRNATESLWDVRAGRLVVADADGNPVLGARYERTDEGGYDVERVEPAALEGWFDEVSIEATVRIPGLGVTVGPRVGIAALRNAMDFGASCLFLRGSGAFAKAWTQITAFLFLFLFTWLASTGMELFRPSIDVVSPILALLGAATVSTVGGVTALLSRLYRWSLDRLS
jgi:hypothetical protein